MSKQFCLPLGDLPPTSAARNQAARFYDRTRQGVEVSLPDGSTHLLSTLLSQANHKQAKGGGFLSVGLTLTPRMTGRAGRSLCPFATAGCAAACFADYDRLAWPKNKRVAVARTRLLAQNPEQFLALLVADLARQRDRTKRLGVPLVCRLNVVSDVPFEREFPALFSRFPDVQFMDYTKCRSPLFPESEVSMSRSLCLPIGVGTLIALGLFVNWKQSNSGVTYAPSGSVAPPNTLKQITVVDEKGQVRPITVPEWSIPVAPMPPMKTPDGGYGGFVPPPSPPVKETLKRPPTEKSGGESIRAPMPPY